MGRVCGKGLEKRSCELAGPEFDLIAQWRSLGEKLSGQLKVFRSLEVSVHYPSASQTLTLTCPVPFEGGLPYRHESEGLPFPQAVPHLVDLSSSLWISRDIHLLVTFVQLSLTRDRPTLGQTVYLAENCWT